MPYKDAERQQQYQKEYRRLERAGGGVHPLLSLRLQTAQDVLDLLGEQIAAVRAAGDATTLA